MKKIIFIICLVFLAFTLQTKASFAFIRECEDRRFTCPPGTGNPRDDGQVWCEADSGDPCDPNNTIAFCWPTTSCTEEIDCRTQSDPNAWCDANGGGAGFCGPGVPSSCSIGYCEYTDGTCGRYCANIPACQPLPTPAPATNTPVPGTPTPTSGPVSCAPGNIGCGDCHWFAANGGTCNDQGNGCCYGGPGPTAAITPTPTPPVACTPASFNCSNLTAYNVTTTGAGNIPSSYVRGKAIGNSPYDDTFSGNNVLTVNVGDIVSFSAAQGGPKDPNVGYMSNPNGNQHVRTQFITRSRQIPSNNQSEDVIGSCLMATAQFTQNFCLLGDSKLAWSRNNTNWPYGYWPWVVANGPPPVYRFPVPPNFSSHDADVVTAPTFSETRVEAGVTRVFSGTCNNIRQAQTCCAVTRTSTGPPEQWTCTNTGEDPDVCSSRVFYPAACQFDDAGFRDVPFELARNKTMRKQFNTAGTYTVEATEQYTCGDNNGNPCAIQVVVGTPPPTGVTITGRIWNDDNGNGAETTDGNYTGSATISISPNPTGTITTSWDAATGTYTISNVPQNNTYTITITGLPAQRYFSNNRVSDAQARIILPVTTTNTTTNPTFVSRFYTISGVVFDDRNKNRVRDGSPLEPLYTTGSGIITGGPNGVVNVTAGTYTIPNVKPNMRFNLQYTNPGLEDDYLIWVGIHINLGVGTANPPFSACPGIPTTASCVATSWPVPPIIGDVANLNFAVTNSRPWVQFTGLDVRVDSGFKDVTRAAPETVAASCRDPRGSTGNPGYSSVSGY